MTTRRHFLMLTAGALALSACSRAPLAAPDDPDDLGALRARMRDSVNGLRAAAGVPPLAPDPALDAAAAAHARDMAAGGGLAHEGPDGSMPADRARRAGYGGTLLGEALSGGRQSGLGAVAAWTGRADTRAVLTDPQGRDLGIGLHRDAAGRAWWVLMIGDGSPAG